MNDIATTEKLTAKDFTSDQEVRWCPGCGDYAIVKGVRASLANMGVKRENTVFVHNGICSFTYFTRVLPYKIAHSLYVVSGLFVVLLRVPNLIIF